MNKERQVYILSPVRQVTPEQAKIISEHVKKVKDSGDKVFNPIENAPQEDPTGYNIVMTELAALDKAAKDGGRVDILWNLGGVPSEGSRVDLGISIALGLEYKLVAVFNKDSPTGPQVAYQIILNADNQVNTLHKMFKEIVESDEVVINWHTDMINEEDEWQRIRLGLALGCFARNPNLKIRLGELRGEDSPQKKSYPKVIREIERHQKLNN